MNSPSLHFPVRILSTLLLGLRWGSWRRTITGFLELHEFISGDPESNTENYGTGETQLPLRLLMGARGVRLAWRNYKGHLGRRSRCLHTCRCNPVARGRWRLGGSKGGALMLTLESYDSGFPSRPHGSLNASVLPLNPSTEHSLSSDWLEGRSREG